jgi:hypothetical protein
MANDFVPKASASFFRWVGVLISYLQANLARFNIAETVFAPIKALYDTYVAKYNLASDPATKTPVATTEKKEAEKSLTSNLRPFLKAYVSYNPAVTEGDKRSMELPLHQSSRSSVPPPNTYPDLTVGTGIIRHLKLHFRDHETKKRAKPNGVTCVVVRWAILTTPPTSVEELPNLALDTSSPYDLAFSESQRGSWVYACMAWQNAKGERGPWSEIVSAIIP